MAFTMGQAAVELVTDASRFNAGLNSAFGSLNTFVGRSAKIIGAMTVAAGALGTAMGVKLAVDFEQTEVAFTTIIGSAERARDLMKDLSDLGAQTPFQFPELATSAKMLLAFGVGADDIVTTLTRIGDIASGIGAPMNSIAEIYGKARVQGRLFAEDINQLTGRGIPIIQELAEQFGVTDSEVRKLVENGQINFGHLEQAFIDLTSAGGQFSGMMEAQSKTLGGLFSTALDSISIALRKVATRLIDALNIKGLVAAFVAGVDSIIPALERMAGTVGEVVMDMARWVKENAQVVKALGVLTTSLIGVTVAVRGLTVAFATLTGPVAIALAAIAAAVSTLAYSLGEGETVVGRLKDGFVELAKWVVTAGVAAFTAVEVAIVHWRDVAQLAFTSFKLFSLSAWEDFKHVFGTDIPNLASWFGRNFGNIVTDIANLWITMNQNLWHNWNLLFSKIWKFVTDSDWAGAFGSLLDGVLSIGSKVLQYFSDLLYDVWVFIRDFDWSSPWSGFSSAAGDEIKKTQAIWNDPKNFQFKGLTEGFEFTTESLPAMLQRNLTDKEKALMSQAGLLGGKLGQEFASRFEPRVDAAQRALGLIEDEQALAAGESGRDDSFGSREGQETGPEADAGDRGGAGGKDAGGSGGAFVGLTQQFKDLQEVASAGETRQEKQARNAQRAADAAEEQVKNTRKANEHLAAITEAVKKSPGYGPAPFGP